MIETERLVIKPLSYEQLEKYIKCDNSLEIDLGLNYHPRTISRDLTDALQQTILPNVANKTKNYLYSTLWTAISKTDNKMLGDFCMYGEPNIDGEIEIGYGTYEEFQNQGFMSEMVKGMVEWLKSQVNVKSITASTEKSNMASSRVLQKNGFNLIGETQILFKWKLTIQ